MHQKSKVVVVPVPVGMGFEDAVKHLLKTAGWDQAIVDVLRFHEEKHPEAILYRTTEIKTKVQEEGLDSDTDEHVLHAVFDADAGVIMLNTSVALPEEPPS